MMPETFTFDELTNLVTMLLGNLHRSGIQDGSYTLKQVAERTGFSESALVKDCRAGKLEHVKYGNTLGMTPVQVAELLRRTSRGGDLPASSSVVPDRMAQAIESSRAAARRASPRRKAA